MSIRFTRNRLHVGYRQEDWSHVWCQLDVAAKSPEGEAELLLYKLTLGKAGYREPMEDEVMWLPHFDTKSCEASTLPGKKRKQRQFVTDAYEYLAEKDPEKVRTLEEELDQRKSPRWQSWFTEAKKFKKTKMRQRDARRKTRVSQAREAGATEVEIQKQVNSDTSDSAYESDKEDGTSRSTITDMPPPAGSKKRKPASNMEGRWTASKKKRGDTSGGSNNQRRQSTPRISGARGTSIFSSRQATFSADASAREESTELHDDLMDTSDPNDVLTGLLGQEKWNLNGARTPPPTGMSSYSAGSEHDTTNGQDLSGGHGEANGQPLDEEDDNIVDPQERAARHVREQSMSGMTNEQAYEEAVRQSLAPQERQNDEEVVNSIEEDADDS